MLSTTEGTVSVLDVGRRGSYWDQSLTESELRDHVKIVMLNANVQESDSRDEMMAGDARSMPQFADGEFDVVFSNSTIEHVGTWDN